jgi:hypothetical protein
MFECFNDYDFRNYVSYLRQAGDSSTIHKTLSRLEGDRRNTWFATRERRSELSGYLTDLGIARSLVDTPSKSGSSLTSTGRIGLQLRYALIEGVLRDLAGLFDPAFLARFVETGVWSRDQVLEWAKLNNDPKKSLETVIGQLQRENSAENRENLALIALAISDSISDSDGRVSALADLAEYIPGYFLQRTLEAIGREPNEGSRLGGLRSILPRLNQRLVVEALELAKKFQQTELKLEAITCACARLEEPLRNEAVQMLLEETKCVLNEDSVPLNTGRMPKEMPDDWLPKFVSLIDAERHTSIYVGFTLELLRREAARDPISTLARIKTIDAFGRDDALIAVCLAFCECGMYGDALDAAKEISGTAWDFDLESLFKILSQIPESEWPKWKSILHEISDHRTPNTRIEVLNKMAKSYDDPERLVRMVVGLCEKYEEQWQVLAAGAHLLTPEERQELLNQSKRTDDYQLRSRIIISLVQYLSAPEVEALFNDPPPSVIFGSEPLQVLLNRVCDLGNYTDAIEHTKRLPEIWSDSRAELLTGMAPTVSAEHLPTLRNEISPPTIAAHAARTLCTLIPWFPRSKVRQTVETACNLPNESDRAKLLIDFLPTFPLKTLEAAHHSFVSALGGSVNRAPGFYMDLWHAGFPVLSKSLLRYPSEEIAHSVVTLVKSDDLTPKEKVSFLMDFANAAEDGEHAHEALTIAFQIAEADPSLSPIIDKGLRSEHAPILGRLLAEQKEDRELVLFVSTAARFLDKAAKTSTLGRVQKIADFALRVIGLEAILPEVPPTSRERAVTKELNSAPQWSGDPKTFLTILSILIPFIHDKTRLREKAVKAFLDIDIEAQISLAGLVQDACKPELETVGVAFAAVEQLPDEQKPEAIVQISPWLDESQVQHFVNCLEDIRCDDTEVWRNLLWRACEIGRAQHVLTCLSSIENTFFRSDLLVELAPLLPLDIVSVLAMTERDSDAQGLGALAVRAAELGDIPMAISLLKKRGGYRSSSDNTLERIYELARADSADILIEFANTLYESERPLLLSKLVPRLSRKSRKKLVCSILRMLSSDEGRLDRPKVVEALMPDLKNLPKESILRTWTAALTGSSKRGRKEVFTDATTFAPLLVHHFGKKVALDLDRAISVGGADHWP